MNTILDAIERHANQAPNQPALMTADNSLTYQGLQELIERLSDWIVVQGVKRIGLYGDNCPAWIIADLAAWKAGVTLVPLPVFFSVTQLEHIERSAGVEMRLVCGSSIAMNQVAGAISTPLDNLFAIPLFADDHNSVAQTICKITFTSGTTGNPKGVCLTTAAIERVTLALAEVMHGRDALSSELQQHLNVLPFSTLLENIAGVYVPLYLGKSLRVLPAATLGFSGSSQLSVPTLLHVMNLYQPNSLILLPQILQGIVAAISQGFSLPDSLQFVAVGGAHTSPDLLQQARAIGMPVYEGYGLSECASVVSLNNPAADCIGSVGKPLSHVEVAIKDGGIFVRGNVFSGYLGQPPLAADEWLDTGDLGYIDEQGFIHITGRRKNLLISSFGRNISPEWIETGLLQSPLIAQAMLIGDVQPFCSAIIVLRQTDACSINESVNAVARYIEQLNQSLPDYARIKKFIIADNDFSVSNELLTANGRLRREAILQVYADKIQHLYAGVGSETFETRAVN
jgi:long-subunit acyl-CoA synthetase (AMP-forming)